MPEASSAASHAASTRRAGVYSVHCRATGRRFVGVSDDLPAAIAEHRSALMGHTHRNARMQYDWDTYGARTFDFAIHDELDPQLDEACCAAELAELADLWTDQLDVDEGRSY